MFKLRRSCKFNPDFSIHALIENSKLTHIFLEPDGKTLKGIMDKKFGFHSEVENPLMTDAVEVAFEVAKHPSSKQLQVAFEFSNLAVALATAVRLIREPKCKDACARGEAQLAAQAKAAATSGSFVDILETVTSAWSFVHDEWKSQLDPAGVTHNATSRPVTRKVRANL